MDEKYQQQNPLELGTFNADLTVQVKTLNMDFSIVFLNDPEIAQGSSKKGIITIGKFQEKFESFLGYWTQQDYEQSWINALTRIVTGETRSCLITSMIDPHIANFITWWPLYRIDQAVYIQNQLLFMENVSGKFDPYHPYKWIPDRKMFNETGIRISEWETTVRSLQEFLVIRHYRE
ncbi:MAG: hypothetical protein IAE79_02420 [Anaerolinea sp.]|nr:hypothetical protein [Anaerolinea sp.]